MVAALVTIIGLLLAVIGLAYSYLAHPLAVEWVRRNPSSALSRLSRVLYLPTAIERVPDEITLYEVIYNPAMSNDMYADLSEERKAALSGYLGNARNWRFLLNDEIKLDLKKNSLSYRNLLVSLIVEFASHNYFISRSGVSSDREMATRVGYFVTASVEKATDTRFFVDIVLKRICRIDNEVSETQAWSSCRDLYFVCKMLPYRYTLAANPGEAMTKTDAATTRAMIVSLETEINRYLVSAVDISDAARLKFANLSKKMTEAIQDINAAFDHAEYAELCVRSEIVLSYAHKILFGNSALSEKAVVNAQVYRKIDKVWAALSLRMCGVTERPVSSRPPGDATA